MTEFAGKERKFQAQFCHALNTMGQTGMVPGHIPEVSLVTWLAELSRLSTRDRLGGITSIASPLSEICKKVETRSLILFLR